MSDVNQNQCCIAQASSPNSTYKKKIRFNFGSILKNNSLDIQTVKKEDNTDWCRWGFGFKAPICRASNSWRWFWFKTPSGKVNIIRWTLPRIYYG